MNVSPDGSVNLTRVKHSLGEPLMPTFRWLSAKELRELLSSRAYWLLLLMIAPLVGHSFITAVDTYAEASGIAELQGFARGIQRDFAAVYAGLEGPVSQGPVEGHVNRLKALKRRSYGRAKFDLLRLHVLYAH